MSEVKKIQLELGGLWEKKDSRGNTYFSGSLNGLSIMVFKNTYKKSDKQPDYIMKLVERDRPPAKPADDDGFGF